MTQQHCLSRAGTEPEDDKGLQPEVRSCSRTWPTVFDQAAGDRLHPAEGQGRLDFFMGAGALNYGHNNPQLCEPLAEYPERGGVVHSLDMMTEATWLRRLKVGRAAFDRGVLVETAGSRDEVVKLLPSLLIPERDLKEGLRILGDAITGAMATHL